MKLKRSEWLVLGGLLVLSLVPCAGGVVRLVELASGEAIESLPENPRIRSAPAPVVFHLVSIVPFCLLGAFQFLPSFRRSHPGWHKASGKVVGITGIVSALSGLWMTHFYAFPVELQGVLLYSVRLVVGFGMTACVVLGVAAVLKKRIVQHQAWMIRAYALGQGAGTQVLVTIPWLAAGAEPEGLTRDVLMTVAWIINLIVAEWVIRSSRKPITEEAAPTGLHRPVGAAWRSSESSDSGTSTPGHARR